MPTEAAQSSLECMDEKPASMGLSRRRFELSKGSGGKSNKQKLRNSRWSGTQGNSKYIFSRFRFHVSCSVDEKSAYVGAGDEKSGYVGVISTAVRVN
eukprot:scaffold22459_cov54-Attheya_sp.AAC.3